MKLTNRVVFNSVEALNKLNKLELPVRTAYAVKKNIDALNVQIKFINERRNELINKHGKDGTIKSEDVKAVNAFMTDFQQLLDIEEDIDVKAISIDELGDAKLSSADLDALSFMLTFE